MNPDFIIFVMTIIGVLAGFALGRWEKEDSYVRGYKRGKAIGEAVGRNDR